MSTANADPSYPSRRSRLIRRDVGGIRPMKLFLEDETQLACCVRCGDEEGHQKSGDTALNQCAHCGFDVCRDCSDLSKRTLYSFLFHAMYKNPCLCNQCFHTLRCID